MRFDNRSCSKARLSLEHGWDPYVSGNVLVCFKVFLGMISVLDERRRQAEDGYHYCFFFSGRVSVVKWRGIGYERACNVSRKHAAVSLKIRHTAQIHADSQCGCGLNGHLLQRELIVIGRLNEHVGPCHMCNLLGSFFFRKRCGTNAWKLRVRQIICERVGSHII